MTRHNQLGRGVFRKYKNNYEPKGDGEILYSVYCSVTECMRVRGGCILGCVCIYSHLRHALSATVGYLRHLRHTCSHCGFFIKIKGKNHGRRAEQKGKRTSTELQQIVQEANEKVGMEDEFGDGWNSISEECDCTDCNGTRSTGRCFRSEVGAPIARYCIFFFYTFSIPPPIFFSQSSCR